MIKLSTPKAYATIGPLCGSTGRPLSCTVPLWHESQEPAISHAWYYDLTDDHCLSQDSESLLVWLCTKCAARLEAEGQVCFASTDALCDIPCWQCGAPAEHTERTRR